MQCRYLGTQKSFMVHTRQVCMINCAMVKLVVLQRCLKRALVQIVCKTNYHSPVFDVDTCQVPQFVSAHGHCEQSYATCFTTFRCPNIKWRRPFQLRATRVRHAKRSKFRILCYSSKNIHNLQAPREWILVVPAIGFSGNTDVLIATVKAVIICLLCSKSVVVRKRLVTNVSACVYVHRT